MAVFAFTAAQGDDLRIEAKSESLTPASDVDVRLSLFHPGERWWDDNTNMSPDSRDALLEGLMPHAGLYHVVVEDVADVPGSERRISLRISRR